MGHIRPFSTLSNAERIELYRAAGNVRGCPSCIAFLPIASNIKGVIRYEMGCAKRMNWKMTGVCDFFEREPGSD